MREDLPETAFGLAAPFTECEAMRRVREEAGRLARSDLAIFVTGEPGTGARTLASAIARQRAGRGRLVSVPAAPGEPESWATDAALLLSHPETLPRSAQLALLGAVHRKHGRLVAWGSAGSLDRIEPELRGVLGAGVITLPPLRERGRDVLQWARHFLEGPAARGPGLTAGAEDAILRQEWPGNLAQLEGVLRRAIALREPTSTAPLTEGDLGLQSAPGAALLPLADAVDRFRREYVKKVLDRFGGNRTHAARALGVDTRTVFRYLEDDRDGEGSGN